MREGQCLAALVALSVVLLIHEVDKCLYNWRNDSLFGFVYALSVPLLILSAARKVLREELGALYFQLHRNLNVELVDTFG